MIKLAGVTSTTSLSPHLNRIKKDEIMLENNTDASETISDEWQDSQIRYEISSH